MKKTVINIAVGIVVAILTLSGCLNFKIPNKIIRTTNNVVIKKENSFFPIESFVILEQEFIFTVPCEEQGQSCPPIVVATHQSAGSGFIVDTDLEDQDYVMTAGHICIPPRPQALGMNIQNIGVGYTITMKTGFGRESKGEIVAVDPANDLCLLKVERDLGPGLQVASKDMMLHGKVYNMANPAGLAASLAVPVFDGYYVGDISTVSLFTIPAVGGSSGSPIMNHRNEVVSIVSAAAVRFDEYAIGPKTRSIREFLLAHLP